MGGVGVVMGVVVGEWHSRSVPQKSSRSDIGSGCHAMAYAAAPGKKGKKEKSKSIDVPKIDKRKGKSGSLKYRKKT